MDIVRTVPIQGVQRHKRYGKNQPDGPREFPKTVQS